MALCQCFDWPLCSRSYLGPYGRDYYRTLKVGKCQNTISKMVPLACPRDMRLPLDCHRVIVYGVINPCAIFPSFHRHSIVTESFSPWLFFTVSFSAFSAYPLCHLCLLRCYRRTTRPSPALKASAQGKSPETSGNVAVAGREETSLTVVTTRAVLERRPRG
jgi:hypothetical protein